MTGLEAADRTSIFVPHQFEEHTIDLGEIRMNFAAVGEAVQPALLLIPGQTESWWGYEGALPHLAQHFQAYAVDLRGQGRSTWTPGRYTLDNIGNDLVRFIDLVIGRPTVVSGLSSGGVLAAWLSAYAKPGQVRGAIWEDPPIFSSEVAPPYGKPIRQGGGPMFALYSKWLGDQWTIGDWEGMQSAAATELPAALVAARQRMQVRRPTDAEPERSAATGPPQNMKEYDPEWARAFYTGSFMAGCDHARMISSVKVPVLLTHHLWMLDENSDEPTDERIQRICELVAGTGHPFEYRRFPNMAHSMHGQDPELFARTLVEWSAKLA